MKLTRRPLKPIAAKRDRDVWAPTSARLYGTVNQAGTLRDVPSLGPFMSLGGRLAGVDG